MKKIIQYLIKSILAGMMIAIGGTIFLSLENKVLGASFFGIGLFMIVTRGLNLYTGKVGYIFDNKPAYLIEVFVTVIGNFIGTFLIGFILRFTRLFETINTKAVGMCDIKLNDSVLSIFILSILCGMLMYLAVNGYRDGKDNVHKYASVFLAVIVFILCGFEHSIANMYYFTVAGWSLKAFGYLAVMIIGNGIGGVIVPLCDKLVKKLQEKKLLKSNNYIKNFR